MLTPEDGAVERCAECDGAFRVVGAAHDSVSAIRAAARQGRYLAERVTHISQVEQAQIGHRTACSKRNH